MANKLYMRTSHTSEYRNETKALGFSFSKRWAVFYWSLFSPAKNVYDMVLFCKIQFLWGWHVKKKRRGRRRQWLIRRGTGFEHGATRCLHKVTYLYMLGNHRKAEGPNPAKTSLLGDMKRWVTWMWFHFFFLFLVQLTLLAHIETDTDRFTKRNFK